jgi:histidine triad (HIT) family protein
MPAGDCLFCAIEAGTIPAAIVAEDRTAIAFMDINPASPGHLLVIPRRHSDDLLSAAAEDLQATTLLAQTMAQRVLERLDATGVSFYSFARPDAGQTVFHLHLHVVPRYPGDGLTVPWAEAAGDPAAIAALAERLR